MIAHLGNKKCVLRIVTNTNLHLQSIVKKIREKSENYHLTFNKTFVWFNSGSTIILYSDDTRDYEDFKEVMLKLLDELTTITIAIGREEKECWVDYVVEFDDGSSYKVINDEEYRKRKAGAYKSGYV